MLPGHCIGHTCSSPFTDDHLGGAVWRWVSWAAIQMCQSTMRTAHSTHNTDHIHYAQPSFQLQARTPPPRASRTHGRPIDCCRAHRSVQYPLRSVKTLGFDLLYHCKTATKFALTTGGSSPNADGLHRAQPPGSCGRAPGSLLVHTSPHGNETLTPKAMLPGPGLREQASASAQPQGQGRGRGWRGRGVFDPASFKENIK
jgi:hypothetical protein